MLFPDEFRYSHLARSLADGGGFTWRGATVSQPAALYVYFITPAWGLFTSTVSAWEASKVLGTLALCTQVVPVWWLARDLVGPRLALVPAALAVVGTWMLVSAEAVTETLAFPLATAALCLFAMALRRPGSKLGWLAFALVLVGSWARIQLIVLLPALLASVILDVARAAPGRRRARARAHQPYLLAGALGVVALILLALLAPGLEGEYRGTLASHPSLHRILSKSGLQLLELTAVAGVLPVLLAAAGALSPGAWRDDATGPLLAVFWPAALATVVQSGFFLAGYTPAPWAIGRYVAYAVPVALVLMTVVATRPRLLAAPALGAAAVLALALLARPAIGMIGEERATWGMTYRLHQVLGLGAGAALTLSALVLLGVAAALRARRAGAVAAALTLGGLVGLVLLVQSQATWWQMQKTATSFRTTMPADLEWVDHHVDGPVALLGITQNAPPFDDIDFFNRQITQAFGPEQGLAGRAVQGKVCTFRFTTAGTLTLQAGCGATPSRFFINDPSARVTFHDEVASASDPKIGRVVQLKPGVPPRARSLIVLPCPRRTPTYSATSPDIIGDDAPIACRGSLTGALWLDAPATVAITYAGGARRQTVEAGGRRWTLPPRATTTVTLPAAKGYSQFVAQHDWTASVGTPRVLAVTLRPTTGGKPITLATP